MSTDLKRAPHLVQSGTMVANSVLKSTDTGCCLAQSNP
jgi:hypothetical protein